MFREMVLIAALVFATGAIVEVESEWQSERPIARDCIGDVDGDGDTDSFDLDLLLSDWGCVAHCIGDLDGDYDTDHADLGILLSDYGCGTGPMP